VKTPFAFPADVPAMPFVRHELVNLQAQAIDPFQAHHRSQNGGTIATVIICGSLCRHSLNISPRPLA